MTDPNTPIGEGATEKPIVPPAPHYPAAASDTPPPPPAPGMPPAAPPVPPTAPPAPPAAPSYSAPSAPSYAAPSAPAAPPYGSPAGYGAPAPTKTPVLSLIGMIAGIVGILISAISFGIGGFIFSIAAVVLGFIGRRKEPAARGFWLTALITGFFGILLSVLLIIIAIVALVSSMNSYNYSY